MDGREEQATKCLAAGAARHVLVEVEVVLWPLEVAVLGGRAGCQRAGSLLQFWIYILGSNEGGAGVGRHFRVGRYRPFGLRLAFRWQFVSSFKVEAD